MTDEWISAAEALERVARECTPHLARLAICKRAHAGLIETVAARFTNGNKVADNARLPPGFWWAEGHEALEQNWKTGDFETWVDRKFRLRAFGVRFSRKGIDEMVGPAPDVSEVVSDRPVNAGGRPRAEFWDDMLIEIFRQLWEDRLKVTRQADIEAAMQDWAVANGHSASDSSIRQRARKLWAVLFKEGKN